MKIFPSIFILLVARTSVSALCGCDSCTQEVWDTLATDSSGSYTCGDRISWLQNAQGYDEASACIQVSQDEFPDGPCGPVCDPTKCKLPTLEPTNTPTTQDPTPSPTLNPTERPTTKPTPILFCGCASCTQEVWDSIATNQDGSFTCGDRISWLQTAQGLDEAGACIKVSQDEFPGGPCGPHCDPTKCNQPVGSPTPNPTLRPNPTSKPTQTPPNQKCGGAVNFSNNPTQTCETYLWGPTGDDTMHCFSYGGSADPCHLNNNNDQNDGLFKDPSLCYGDTFYLWDEPDTQGRDYFWAGREWLSYSERFSQELVTMRSRGTKVTGPLLKAGDRGVLEQHMRTFFNACGPACSDETDPAYIDVIAVNGFCGPWNGAAGCRGGASFIYDEAEQVSRAFNNLPVYMTNWSRLQTSSPADQIDAMEAIDEFFPSSGGVVERVYWFGARDFGGGAETTGYLTNSLPDGGTLGELWRMKCTGL